MPTMNLTPDMETGIGRWPEDKFVRAVKYGQVEGEPSLRYPMQPYVHLSDDEVKAIYAYLRTLDPVSNKVEREF